MATSQTIYLPFSTQVIVYGYTNAAFTQRITCKFEDGDTQVMTGTGEQNTPTSPPRYIKNTPSSGPNPNGFAATVTVDHKSSGSSQWTPSQLNGGSCSVALLYHVLLVVSEDWDDQDWNDGVIQFCWWTKP